MTRHRIGIAFLLFALTSISGFAQTPQRRVLAPASGPERLITAAERRQLAEILPHLLETLYVIPEKGKQLAQQVRSSFESGKYDGATTASMLAAAINRDLASANDRHLGMRYSSDNASKPLLTIDAWKTRFVSMGSRAMEREYDRDAIRLVNFGVLGAKVLEGNIGYLEMREFMSTDETRAALSNAMALLAHTDAMIVDVRNCPGGAPDTVSYLASYFFGPERRVLMSRYNRPLNRSTESTTVDVPGQRMPNTDLYVLTGRTASACESFAFTLQQWGRARTVGEKTAGAGNNNMFVDVGGGLTFSISVGTAVHPKTGKGFEAIGVQPDIAVPADRALDAARAEALRALSAKATTEPQRRAVQTALRNMSSGSADDAIVPTSPVPAQPTAPATAANLEDYVGTYGSRQISIRDGALYYQRIGGQGGVLKPLSRDQFDLNGDVLITFHRGSNRSVTSMRIEWTDGRSETVPRETR